MNSPIEWPDIESNYLSLLDELSQLVPLKNWHIRPAGIGLTKHKTKYGIAYSDGRIEVSCHFIGTTARAKLAQTLRHEFAHLAVGVHHGHNGVFRRCERLFGARPTAQTKDEEPQLHQAIGYKYRLLATLEDGREIDVGGYHRRSRNYLDYPCKKRGYCYRVKGLKVTAFRYLSAA